MVKYDWVKKQVNILSTSNGEVQQVSLKEIENAVAEEPGTKIDKMFPWIETMLEAKWIDRDGSRLEINDDDVQDDGELALERVQVPVELQVFYVVYTLVKSVTPTAQSVKYNAIKNAFNHFSQ